MIIGLVWGGVRASYIFMMAVGAFLLLGITPIETFLKGFSNLSILTIMLLIVITAGISDHFSFNGAFERLFGTSVSIRGFILRMGASVAAISSIMNNTPVVAMMMPYVHSWGKKYGVSPSKLLIPLSYMAIVGGVVTLIGTSTNLVLNGLLEASGQELLSFWDFLVPGALVAISCLLVIVWLAPILLKNRKDVLQAFEENSREYLVETVITDNAPIVDKTVEEAELRNLKGVFLTEVIRNGEVIAPIRPTQTLKASDVLLFAGETGSIFDLLKEGKGLELAKKRKFQINETTDVIESVVAQNSALDRSTLKDISFREKFDAAVIGIHRKGEKLTGKLGIMPLRTGDLMLLTPGPEFKARNQEDLIVINTISRVKEMKLWRKRIFGLAILVSLVLMLMGAVGLFEGLLALLAVQLALGMMSLDKLKSVSSLDLLIILVSSLTIGSSLVGSGAADFLANTIFANAHSWSPRFLIFIVFVITFLLTSFVTNIAAIAIVFPILLSLTTQLPGMDKVLYLTAAYAASCCFITPYAYQTNIMVMELGKYRFKDFLKLGLPLSLVYGAVFLSYAIYTFDL